MARPGMVYLSPSPHTGSIVPLFPSLASCSTLEVCIEGPALQTSALLVDVLEAPPTDASASRSCQLHKALRQLQASIFSAHIFTWLKEDALFCQSTSRHPARAAIQSVSSTEVMLLCEPAHRLAVRLVPLSSASTAARRGIEAARGISAFLARVFLAETRNERAPAPTLPTSTVLGKDGGSGGSNDSFVKVKRRKTKSSFSTSAHASADAVPSTTAQRGLSSKFETSVLAELLAACSHAVLLEKFLTSCTTNGCAPSEVGSRHWSEHTSAWLVPLATSEVLKVVIDGQLSTYRVTRAPGTTKSMHDAEVNFSSQDLDTFLSDISVEKK